MNRSLFVTALAAVALALPAAADDTVPPDAAQKPHEMTLHGDTRVDPYYWMNDREDPEVIAYLEAENAYAKAMMADTEALQDDLFEEIVGRIDPTDESVPYEFNGYWYYTRYEDGLDYPIYCRKKGSLEASEEVMVDANELAEGTSYFSLSGLSVSSDNEMIAFGIDTVGRRKYTIWLKDLTNGEMIESGIVDVTSNLVWAEDARVLFYTAKDDETLRSHQVWRHEVGTGRDDVLIFEETDETFSCYVTKTKSRDYLVIGSSQTVEDEYRILPANDPMGEWSLFEPRERGHEYSIDHADDRWVIRTNWDATNFRLMEVRGDDTTRKNWTELVPHRDDVMIESFDVFQDFLVVRERKGGLPHIVITPKNGTRYEIEFDDPTYSAWTTTNLEVDTETLRFGYMSMTTPATTYDFDMVTKERELKKQTKVLGDFDPSNYESQYLWAEARDGTKVPVSLVYRKDMLDRGKNPTVLYAYGSYGSSSWASFSSSRLSLLDRGFVWAIAHIRGGQELGRQWYEDGKLLNKKNTFTDFIDCARFLKQENWADPDRTYGYGGSAGGLLVGAVVNMAPQEFDGVIAAVPFVDVVTTMLDETIPLTTFEWDEWGNPKDEVYYDYMLSYSPYDQVTAQDYPNILITAGLHDSQVQYFEPAKWTAKLRDMNTSDNMILFYCNMEAGHGGASGRLSRQKETARNYAFFLKLAGEIDAAAMKK